MDSIEFIEKFTPDFKTKWAKHWYEMTGEEVEPEEYDGDATFELFGECFPEALQAFADRICEKQREICAQIGQDSFDKECAILSNCKYCKGCCVDDNAVEQAIIQTEQPKIDEL